MLARLKSAIFSPGIPSALLAIGTFGTTVEFLHLIPENGTTERFSLTSSATTFRRYGATEQSRQQIGDITLHEQDLEALDTFVDDVEARARQLWKGSLKAADVQEGEMEATRLVQDVLRSAAIDTIRERGKQDLPMNATRTYPVFVVCISRSKTGGIMPSTFTSFPG